MTDLVSRFMSSTSPRVVEARKIPGLAVHFFDRQKTFENEFTTGRKQGDPTDLTPTAQQYYNTELKNILITDGFKPLDKDTPLNQWTPDHEYYSPGQPQG